MAKYPASFSIIRVEGILQQVAQLPSKRYVNLISFFSITGASACLACLASLYFFISASVLSNSSGSDSDGLASDFALSGTILCPDFSWASNSSIELNSILSTTQMAFIDLLSRIYAQ